MNRDPATADLLLPFLRGQDTARWNPEWRHLWMIAVKSSENFAWPGADAGDHAEQTFRQRYPAVHSHLRK